MGLMRGRIAILLVVLSSVAVGQDSPDDLIEIAAPSRADLPIPVVIGPNSASAGDLVVLDASESVGTAFAWAVVPELANDRLTILPIEGGKKCILVSVPGQYTVILAVATKDGIALKKHTVTVRGTLPGPQPGPRPGPAPQPDPGPQPPPDGEFKLAAYVISISNLMPDKTKASGFAQAFDSVASEAAAGALRTASQIDSATANANRTVIAGQDRNSWLPFFTKLNEQVDKLSESGDLQSTDDYVTAWSEIAEGFRRVR